MPATTKVKSGHEAIPTEITLEESAALLNKTSFYKSLDAEIRRKALGNFRLQVNSQLKRQVSNTKTKIKGAGQPTTAPHCVAIPIATSVLKIAGEEQNRKFELEIHRLKQNIKCLRIRQKTVSDKFKTT